MQPLKTHLSSDLDSRNGSGSASAGSFASQETRYSECIDDLSGAMIAFVDPTDRESASGVGGSNKRKSPEDANSSASDSGRSGKAARRDSQDIANAADVTDHTKPVVVVTHPGLQPYLQSLPWGIRWELGRLILAGLRPDQITVEMIQALRGGKPAASHVCAASKMEEFFHGSSSGMNPASPENPAHILAAAFSKEEAAKSPWQELDKEMDILSRHPLGAVGCNHDQDYLADDPDWYGGKVHFIARLSWHKNGNPKLLFDRPVLGPSRRLSRRFGSAKFIRIRIPPETVHQEGNRLLDYFRRPFVVLGNVFRAFFAKEASVFLVQTNEIVDPDNRVVEPAHGSTSARSGSGLSFLEFLHWHNNPELNNNQTMAKWSSRFALGLSNSVPGVRVSPNMFYRIDDIVSPAFKGSGKVSSELQMTDGCGFANAQLFKLLQDKFQWQTYPVAVQCRVEGAKGLLLLHPDHAQCLSRDEPPAVWVRPSQTKIIYPPHSPIDTDHALLTVDILRSSRLTSPAKLSVETIISLAENRVPFKVFEGLLEKGLSEQVKGLTEWEGEDGIFRLWANVARRGGVISARLARFQSGLARAKGYVFDDVESEADTQEEGDDEDGLKRLDAALNMKSTAWWEDPISGCPSALEETVMVLLDSGFVPDKCEVLRAKLKEVIKAVIKRYTTRYRIDVAKSCSAFIVPDPCGVLEPGEVHIKSSRRNLQDLDGQPTDIVLGDVLLTRHPCKIATDVQKAKAVFKAELRNYVDVIIVSTKGHIVDGKYLGRHLPSMTGGGDFDGDLMQVFWEPEIVQAFKSADPSIANEPKSLQACLSKENKTVKEFLAEFPPERKAEHIAALQGYLLGSLRDSFLVGKYSTMWENCTYMYGYNHEETIRLAHLFCAILDGAKTGVTIDPDQWERDKKKYLHERGPAWKEKPEEAARFESRESNATFLRRGRGLGEFVMEFLRKAGDKITERQRQLVDRRLKTLESFKPDDDLIQPWLTQKSTADLRAARGLGNEMQLQLAAIAEHVEKVYSEWKAKPGASTGGPKAKGKGKESSKGRAGFTDLPIVERQDILRQLSLKFSLGPPVDEVGILDEATVRRLKASYAYLYDSLPKKTGSQGSRWTRFPWDMAMRELCAIKAQAGHANAKTVRQDFYSRFTIHKTFLDND